jgi:hypothetical protein
VNKIKHVVKQCIRGTKTLPGVGEHPGTEPLILMMGMILLVSLEKELPIIIFINLFTTMFFGSIYLWGAYNRAETSDREHKQ